VKNDGRVKLVGAVREVYRKVSVQSWKRKRWNCIELVAFKQIREFMRWKCSNVIWWSQFVWIGMDNHSKKMIKESNLTQKAWKQL